MYPEELEYFIKVRNFYIGGDDLLKVISQEENPQLSSIVYKAYDNRYYMDDCYGNHYEFTPMSYEEAVEKKLVKTYNE